MTKEAHVRTAITAATAAAESQALSHMYHCLWKAFGTAGNNKFDGAHEVALLAMRLSVIT